MVSRANSQANVIKGDLGEEVRDHGGTDLERRDFGGQDTFGAVGEILEVHGGKPDDFRHGDGGQNEIRAAQAEADGAYDEGDHDDHGHTRPHAEPGRDLLELHEHHRGIGADPEISRMPDGVLASVTAEDVPAFPHDDAEEEKDHDMKGIGALHEMREQEKERKNGNGQNSGDGGKPRVVCRYFFHDIHG